MMRMRKTEIRGPYHVQLIFKLSGEQEEKKCKKKKIKMKLIHVHH